MSIDVRHKRHIVTEFLFFEECPGDEMLVSLKSVELATKNKRLNQPPAKQSRDLAVNRWTLGTEWKYGPSDVEVISWLAGYYRQHQEFENAVQFFESVSDIASNESPNGLIK
jgi:hypothetical protein